MSEIAHQTTQPAKKFVSNEFLVGMAIQFAALVFAAGVAMTNIENTQARVRELGAKISQQADIKERTIRVETQLLFLDESLKRIERVLDGISSSLRNRASNDHDNHRTQTGNRR